MVTFVLVFPFVAAGVCVVCSGKLALKLFLVIVVPLKEILFIVRGNRREKDVVNVCGEYNDVVGGRVGVVCHDL